MRIVGHEGKAVLWGLMVTDGINSLTLNCLATDPQGNLPLSTAQKPARDTDFMTVAHGLRILHILRFVLKSHFQHSRGEYLFHANQLLQTPCDNLEFSTELDIVLLVEPWNEPWSRGEGTCIGTVAVLVQALVHGDAELKNYFSVLCATEGLFTL